MEESRIFFKRKKGWFREYSEAILTALLFAFIIRSFVVEAFKIPSGSMIPTLMVGDHIFVNKFTYGLRVPFTKKKLITFRSPERGEPIVFIYPLDETKDYIKRVIGLPGDRVRINGDDVFVNDKPLSVEVINLEKDQATAAQIPVTQTAVSELVSVTSVPVFPDWQDYKFYVESVGERKHLIQYDSQLTLSEFDVLVPPDHVFVMGDNRDNSADSRVWGFVPIENVKGTAMFIWLSIDYDRKTIRWNRFGKSIQ